MKCRSLTDTWTKKKVIDASNISGQEKSLPDWGESFCCAVCTLSLPGVWGLTMSFGVIGLFPGVCGLSPLEPGVWGLLLPDVGVWDRLDGVWGRLDGVLGRPWGDPAQVEPTDCDTLTRSSTDNWWRRWCCKILASFWSSSDSSWKVRKTMFGCVQTGRKRIP